MFMMSWFMLFTCSEDGMADLRLLLKKTLLVSEKMLSEV